MTWTKPRVLVIFKDKKKVLAVCGAFPKGKAGRGAKPSEHFNMERILFKKSSGTSQAGNVADIRASKSERGRDASQLLEKKGLGNEREKDENSLNMWQDVQVRAYQGKCLHNRGLGEFSKRRKRRYAA